MQPSSPSTAPRPVSVVSPPLWQYPAQVFKYDVSIGVADGPCSVAVTDGLVRSLERAVFGAITDSTVDEYVNVADTPVPPSTSVKV